MSDPTTPVLGLSKPVNNADADTWGTTTNADWDIVDAFAAALAGFISGLTLSTAGASATFSVAAGTGGDSTGPLMALAASISKTTGSWAVGATNGSLDSGTISNSTWYHAFLIKRVDTGVVDVLVSLSATSPALPTNYTLSRRIGSMKTDGSAHWTKFVQFGDRFIWDAQAANDLNLVPSSSPVLEAVNTPLGVMVVACIRGCFQSDATQTSALLIASPSEASLGGANASDARATTNSAANGVGDYEAGFTVDVLTNTASQVLVSASGNAAVNLVRASAYGWIDNRGRN
jgi:hypothetical protein